MKKVLFNNEAKVALKKGIDIVAEAVKVTLGPRGKNVVIDTPQGPTITNDGVSIAKDITLEDKFENMGARIIRQAAEKTNDAAGDGTTTATTLAHAMITEGLKKTAMGVSPVLMKQGIDLAADKAIEELTKIARPVKGEEIKQVASISAESEEIGSIIAETIQKVGEDGVVTVEEGQTIGVTSEVVEGMSIDKGYVSPYMATDGVAEVKNPLVIITDQTITTPNEIIPLIEKTVQSGKKDILLIAEDITGEALATLVVNKVRGVLNIVAIKAPGFGDNKKELLEDIAATTGASVISRDKGYILNECGIDVCGQAASVRSTKDETILISSQSEGVKERIKMLKSQEAKSKFEKDQLKKRIAKLSGGVAVIRVGAATETEMKYLKHKIEDAVQATKAAIEEGIVPGGGVTLAKLSTLTTDKNDEIKAGFETVINSLTVPMQQILINAGLKPDIIVDTVIKEDTGYNAKTNEYVDDMFKAGIIDPVKVTRNALKNAASAAGIFLTTEVAIAEE